MPKTHTTISLEHNVLKQSKDLKLNISGVCEDALTAKIKELKPVASKEEDYKKAWKEIAKVADAEEYIKRLKAVRIKERECITEDRELWNKTYSLIKEQFGADYATDQGKQVERTEKRIALFKQLKEAEELIK